MRVRLGLGLLCALFLAAWAAPAAHAEDVFLIVSVDEQFDTTVDFEDEDFGSATIVVRIGSLTNNVPDPRQTHFLPGSEPPTVPLGDIALSELNGNPSTIFGSFTVEEYVPEQESVMDVPHMVTPGTPGINPEIQAAVFAASSSLASAVGEDAFMTTGEIAEFVYNELPEGSEVTLPEIAAALFGQTEPLGVVEQPDETFSCEAEGELFPHPKNQVEPLFDFAFAFDKDGNFTAFDVCQLVEIDVLAKKINLKSKGKLKVAILSSDTFDATEVDECTAQIGGVYAVKAKVKDVNKDCLDDLVVYFKISDLVCEGVLDECTEELTLEAELFDGSCITGTDSVVIKGKNDKDDCDDECDCGDDDCGECGKDKDDCDDDDDGKGKGKGKDDDKGKGKK